MEIFEKQAELGKVYQHRNLKTLGRLIAKNENRKLYILEKPDGDTLEISYAVFFSYWREYDEELQYEFENANDYIFDNAEYSEVGPDAKSTRRTNKLLDLVRYRNTATSESMYNYLIRTTCHEMLNKFEEPEYFSEQGIPDKYGVAIKYCGSRMLEIYTKLRRKSYLVFMKGVIFENIDWTINLKNSSVMSRPDFKLDTFFYVKSEDLPQFCADVVHAVNITLSQQLKDYEN